MAILNNLLKGQLIWTNQLGDIQDQKGCVFLRHPVDMMYQPNLKSQLTILFRKPAGFVVSPPMANPHCDDVIKNVYTWMISDVGVDDQKSTTESFLLV